MRSRAMAPGPCAVQQATMVSIASGIIHWCRKNLRMDYLFVDRLYCCNDDGAVGDDAADLAAVVAVCRLHSQNLQRVDALMRDRKDVVPVDDLVDEQGVPVGGHKVVALADDLDGIAVAGGDDVGGIGAQIARYAGVRQPFD